MPAHVTTKGKPEDLVPVQVKVPLWLKRRAHQAAAALGKSYSDFLKDAIRDASDVTLAAAERVGRKSA